MTPDHAYAFMAHSIDAGRLAQAYVVSAPPRGAGDVFVKRVMSRLLCREPQPPCGHCSRCITVEKGTHPDVHWLEPQKKSRIISIDAMRDEFMPEIQRTSFEGGWKAGVIVGADCLNNAAANAFLKTLEEPPARTVFFLLTDSPQRLLPTINSRCQHLAIDDASGMGASPEDQRELVAILAGAGGVDGIATAFGRADRLTAFMKARKTEIEKETKREARDDSDEDIDEETLDARIGARYREWRHGILCAMLNWYRDILVLVCGGDEQYLSFPGEVETLRASAAACTYRRALEQVQAVENAVVQLNRNLTESLVFANAFFKLIGS
jgi:DNA polymerase III subunit delta'